MKAATNDSSHLVGIQGSALRGAIARNEQELTLPRPRDDAPGGRVGTKPTRRLSQDIVSHVMTERSIDFTHVAHVDQNERYGRRTLRRGDNLFQLLLDQRAVRQAREGVVMGLISNIRFTFG